MDSGRPTNTGSYTEPDLLPHLLLGLLLFCSMVLAWPGLVAGLLLRLLMGSEPVRRWWLWTIAAGLAVWWGLRTLQPEFLHAQLTELGHEALRETLRQEWQALLRHLVPFWLGSLALAPLVAGVLVLRRGIPAQQAILAPDKQQKELVKRRMRQAARQAAHAPSNYERGLHANTTSVLHRGRQFVHALSSWGEARQKLVLGCAFDGDLALSEGAWSTRRIGPKWFVVPEHELRLPGVLIGASGSGKTETALRLATEAAGTLGWQVIYLDAKGDYATAARFLAAMRATNVQRIAMFPVDGYDGWRGDETAILNRLLATQDFTEEYYQAVAKQLLYLAINLPGAGGPPRTARELLRRLELETLREAYRGRPEARKLAGIDPKQAYGVLARYDGFFSALRGQLDGKWAFEDVDAAFVLLPGLALKENATGAGRYVIEDFAQYVVQRKEPGRHTLLIIDEFSALSLHTDAASLFERLRSYDATVFVSSQSYAGLGANADRILDAANLLIVHRTSDPRRLVERAGMARQVEASHVILGEEMTGRATLRSQDRLKVDPNAVRQLEPGEAFVIAHGRASRVVVARARVEATAVKAMRAELEMWEQAARRGDESRNEAMPEAVLTLPYASAVDPASLASPLMEAEGAGVVGGAPEPVQPRRKVRTRRKTIPKSIGHSTMPVEKQKPDKGSEDASKDKPNL